MHKRRRKAEMAASTIAMLASPNATTKGGGRHVLLFFLFTRRIGPSGLPCSLRLPRGLYVI